LKCFAAPLDKREFNTQQMKIILLSRVGQKTGSRHFCLSRLIMAAVVAVTLAIGGAFWSGYQMGRQPIAQQQGGDAASQALREMLVTQRANLQQAQGQTQSHLDALALRLGQMQSHILRLNALGERLTELSDLDSAEFDFASEPPRGGLDRSGSDESMGAGELLVEMNRLSQMIKDREHKLSLLEGLLFDDQINDQLRPSGRPVQKGWVSSRYGYRKDPFNGKKAFHRGVDIAGKMNSNVIAVAAGIVTWAGKRGGYGYAAEIQHANGYATLYGHNSKIFVKVGDLASKGQVIGLMGSSGRSTGPHVHFEIARNGKTLNPAKYLRR
jgi:murein DD-endopeptidase MepM/ murein hydrolase activator NlpD